MTYHSRKAIVSILTTLSIFIYLYIDLLKRIQEVGTASTEPRLWAIFFFKLIIVQIVVKIVVLIIFNIINTILTKEGEPRLSDERDRLIELKSVRNFSFMFALGFFVAMGSLVMNQPISTMFSIFAFNIAASGVVLDLSYIVCYERGY